MPDFSSGKCGHFSEMSPSLASARFLARFSRFGRCRLQRQYVQLNLDKTEAANLWIDAFHILICVMQTKKYIIRCCFANFVKKWPTLTYAELYCLFIAADSIVDAISFIRRIVLLSRNKFLWPWLWPDFGPKIRPGLVPGKSDTSLVVKTVTAGCVDDVKCVVDVCQALVTSRCLSLMKPMKCCPAASRTRSTTFSALWMKTSRSVDVPVCCFTRQTCSADRQWTEWLKGTKGCLIYCGM